MKIILALVLTLSLYARAGIYNVGDKVSNLCWKTVEEGQFCLDDKKGEVRVLLYNTGWCPPCNSAFTELSPRVQAFEGKAVTFISLSAAGWKKGSPPDTQFLKEWQSKFDIKFVVAASPGDAGKLFFSDVYIPNVVILDKNAILSYKAVAPSVDKIFLEVNRQLGKE